MRSDDATRERELLGVDENLIDTAACLDRSCDWQGVIAFDEKPAPAGALTRHRSLQSVGVEERRFDDTACRAELRKELRQEGSEAIPACLGLEHVTHAELHATLSFAERQSAVIDPQERLPRDDEWFDGGGQNRST